MDAKRQPKSAARHRKFWRALWLESFREKNKGKAGPLMGDRPH
jgi:hypothetical protein